MNKLIKKPYLIFWTSIPIISLLGFFIKADSFGFNVHDTYFVIATNHLIMLISLLFVIIGLGYWIMEKANRKLSKWLNLIHITLTFGGILIVLILTQCYRNEIMEYDFNNNLTLSITLILITVIFGQLIFPINIIRGLIKKLPNP
ncbi:cbb3-type cytochrome c oxidase subunit I [Hanstruepera ponticola]|uniref:cbb3-type cytochrome c oxidase subunit I n=1 Tax=Hanstruepera ponticola TaxID=2042995 RepID=UPI000CF08E09|nr:cbb3-type cytochrome c oxidase subunit I [Hanstruepera ponticola]